MVAARPLAVAVAGVLLAAPLCVAGLSSEPYAITAWTADKGVPAGDILAMAQDADGYLWLGTTGGLFRFDGFDFKPWSALARPALAGTSITALLASRDGSLWIGFGDSDRVSRLRGGRLETATGSAGGPGAPVWSLLEDRAGTIWAGSRRGLAAFRGGAWHLVGDSDGLPPGEVLGVYEDREGRLWIGSSAGVFRRSPGAARFELVDGRARSVRAFVEDASGAIWTTDLQRVVNRIGARDAPRLGPSVELPAASLQLLRDRRGSVWVAALGNGLMRLRAGAAGRALLERVNYETKITGGARSLFEDAEGSIWVGIRGGGLLRVAETIISTDIRLAGVTSDGVRALTVSADGTVWAATGHAVNAISPRGVRAFSFSQTTALHADTRGSIWAVAAHGVGRFVNGGFQRLPLGRPIRLELVSSMTTDEEGSVWLCSSADGLLRWRGGRLAEVDGVSAAPRPRCGVVFRDREGRIWAGFASGDVAVYDRSGARLFGRMHGLAGDAVQAFAEDAGGTIWVATASGVSRFSNGRFTTITADNGLPGRLVPSLVADDRGYIWLGVGSGAGIVRVNPSEMDLVAHDPSHQVRYTLYDVTDGLQGELHWRSRPSAVRGGDGRLWFATGNTLAVVDPRQAPVGRRRPPPRIDSITAGARRLSPDASGAVLRADESPLQIDFGALNLSGASKVRFRYMLEGISSDWVELGGRRQVSFANLPPGLYRLRLNATNGGGWSQADTVWAFSVRPPFSHTPSFYLLCAAAAALLVWAAWWMRLQAVRRRFALVMAERARLSREIHDTLLQSLVGVALQFQALSQRTEFQAPAVKEELLQMRQEVEAHIREARQSISELRSPMLERLDLTSALRNAAERMARSARLAIHFHVEGAPRRHGHRIEEALLRIGQEAVLNAVRHARASHLEVLLRYDPAALVLRVRDDGIGFDGLPVEGHYGLIDMEERAKEVGGQWKIMTAPGRGTEVEAIVPVAATA